MFIKLFWNTWKDRISLIKNQESKKQPVSSEEVKKLSEKKPCPALVPSPRKNSSISITGQYLKNFTKVFKPNEQKLLNRSNDNQKSISVKCCMLKGAAESLIGSPEVITDFDELEEDDIFINESDCFESCEAEARNKSMHNLLSFHCNNWY